MTEPNPDINPSDLLKILVASDIHLGYNETDPIRGNDSFITFEEILQHAVQNDVDFILLGGDLFHDANPSMNSVHRCLKLLRTYTLGDKPITIEFLSDPSVNFYDSLTQTVNYEDPNINIAYPVFSIHGNHDDLSGFNRLSSLDLLSTSGLVNYFGKWVDLTKIDISPLLMKKGRTQLALYGLSYIPDSRLNRLLHDSKVIMEVPDSESGDWFNILVLHQNRADRGPKKYIPEEILPTFLDLIVWGHEHDCRIWPEENDTTKFFVTQPGSSVATSLAEGEAIDKHVGLLQIYEKKFILDSIKLKTVRPFIFESVTLSEYEDELSLNEIGASKRVNKFAVEKITKMLEEAKSKCSDHPNQPKEPLIRLRLIYKEEEEMFNTIRFGQEYIGRVANNLDMVVFKKNKKLRNINTDVKFDKSAMDNAFKKEEHDDETRIEDIVDRYFLEVNTTNQLKVLSTISLAELCRRLVYNNDDDAAEKILEYNKVKACEFLNSKMPAKDDVQDELLKFKAHAEEIYQLTLKMLDNRGAEHFVSEVANISIDESETKTSALRTASSTTRGRKPAAAPASRAQRGRGSRGGGRGNAKKDELNITNTKAVVQPTIDVALSQSRSSQRLAIKKPTRFTQYIDDSD